MWGSWDLHMLLVIWQICACGIWPLVQKSGGNTKSKGFFLWIFIHNLSISHIHTNKCLCVHIHNMSHDSSIWSYSARSYLENWLHSALFQYIGCFFTSVWNIPLWRYMIKHLQYIILSPLYHIIAMSHGHHGIWNHWQINCLFKPLLRLVTNINNLDYGLLWLLDSLHIGPVMKKVFLCHDVIMSHFTEISSKEYARSSWILIKIWM